MNNVKFETKIMSGKLKSNNAKDISKILMEIMKMEENRKFLSGDEK